MNATAETSRLLFRSNTAQRGRLIYSNTVDLLNMVRYAIFETGLTRIAVLWLFFPAVHRVKYSCILALFVTLYPNI